MPSCPDQGTCHHDCIAGCYRVLACAPFKAVVIIDDADLRENLIGSIAAHADTIADLRSTLCEQEQEIARHHKDFERWEAMADKGARQIRNAAAAKSALEGIVGSIDWLKTTANKGPSSLVHVHPSVVSYARTVLEDWEVE
jgi:hypothetical protein